MVNVVDVTWANFWTLFEADYKIVNMTYLRTHEFITLSQGSNRVEEYSMRFNALAITRNSRSMGKTKEF